MTKLTVNDLMLRLGIPEIQIEMAEYSGYIPKSTNNQWDSELVEQYLVRWENRIQQKLSKEDKH